MNGCTDDLIAKFDACADIVFVQEEEQRDALPRTQGSLILLPPGKYTYLSATSSKGVQLPYRVLNRDAILPPTANAGNVVVGSLAKRAGKPIKVSLWYPGTAPNRSEVASPR